MGYKDPDKRRFLTVLEGGIPDRVPNFEVLIMSRVASAILGRDVPDTLTGAMSVQDYVELVHLVEPADSGGEPRQLSALFRFPGVIGPRPFRRLDPVSVIVSKRKQRRFKGFRSAAELHRSCAGGVRP